MTTTRLSAPERKLPFYDDEPALGTVAERLDIIIRRHGGNTKRPKATQSERREYLAWLAANDPTATNPYAAVGK